MVGGVENEIKATKLSIKLKLKLKLKFGNIRIRIFSQLLVLGLRLEFDNS